MRWDIPTNAGEFPVDARDIPMNAGELPVDAGDIPADAREFRAGSIVGRYRQVLQGVFALTPFVPPSREAGEGERAAGRTAVRPYTPRPRCDYGVRKRSFRLMLKLTLQHSKSVGARLPSPTAWERGWG